MTLRTLSLCQPPWLFSLIILLPRQGSAFPTGGLQPRQNVDPNADPNANPNDALSPKLWVPAVIVAAILFVAFLFVWTRKGIFSQLRRNGAAIANNARAGRWSRNQDTRVLTADQLVGRNTAANGATNATRPVRTGRDTNATRPVRTDRDTNATRPVRTGRRTRRTPSQISTKSLPVYNKEPGDQELVIFRGPDEEDMPADGRNHDHDDMDSDTGDADMTQQVPMYSVHEMPLMRNATGGGHNRNGSNTDTLGSHRRDMSDSTFDLSGFGSTTHLMPVRSLRDDRVREMDQSRGGAGDSGERNDDNAETGTMSDESGTGLLDHSHSRSGSSAEVGATNTDPRGEAPPYWEVVGEDHPSSESSGQPPPGLPFSSSTGSSPMTPDTLDSAPTSPSVPSQRRRSVFSNFFGGLTGANSSTPPVPPLPSSLANSATTSNLPRPSLSQDRQTSQEGDSAGHTRHRASQSGSGSTMGFVALTPFRTISRQRSITTLASGSSTSQLNLTQTASRNTNASRTNLHMSSPSATSLNSINISAPLAHTLTKTEIRYPKGGPTPEQVRLLSSRESLTLGRFALPFGGAAQARAHAASRSRVDVSEDGREPPLFEDVVPSNGAVDGGGSASGSRDEDRNGSTSEERRGASSSTVMPSSLEQNPSHSPTPDEPPRTVEPLLSQPAADASSSPLAAAELPRNVESLASQAAAATPEPKTQRGPSSRSESRSSSVTSFETAPESMESTPPSTPRLGGLVINVHVPEPRPESPSLMTPTRIRALA